MPIDFLRLRLKAQFWNPPRSHQISCLKSLVLRKQSEVAVSCIQTWNKSFLEASNLQWLASPLLTNFFTIEKFINASLMTRTKVNILRYLITLSFQVLKQRKYWKLGQPSVLENLLYLKASYRKLHLYRKTASMNFNKQFNQCQLLIKISTRR